MKIDKHISALLYEHDCVIVPEFGGFVTGYAPASIHPAKYLFSPPHKYITFNKHLKSNDGLLANQISINENKTFNEAGSILKSFVTETNILLKQGEKVVLDQIGSLYLDVERNMQFEPDTTVNYLIESFGMSAIQSLPVKRESRIERVEKEFVDRKPIPQEKAKRKAFIKVSSLITILIVAFAVTIIFLSLKTNAFKNINYSSLNPFATKLIRPEVSPPIKDAVPVKPSIVVKDTVSVKKTISETLPVQDKTSVTTSLSKSTQGLKFHVVSGCFRIESNARNFVAMMKAKNLNASIIGRNKDGLYIVSCGDYANREDAYKELALVRSGNTPAWMLEQ